MIIFQVLIILKQNFPQAKNLSFISIVSVFRVLYTCAMALHSEAKGSSRKLQSVASIPTFNRAPARIARHAAPVVISPISRLAGGVGSDSLPRAPPSLPRQISSLLEASRAGQPRPDPEPSAATSPDPEAAAAWRTRAGIHGRSGSPRPLSEYPLRLRVMPVSFSGE
jgi:hypothetical protein